MEDQVYSVLGTPVPKYPLTSLTAVGQIVMVLDGETRGIRSVLVTKDKQDKKVNVYYATPTELIQGVRYLGQTVSFRSQSDMDSLLRQALRESCIKSAAQMLMHIVSSWPTPSQSSASRPSIKENKEKAAPSPSLSDEDLVEMLQVPAAPEVKDFPQGEKSKEFRQAFNEYVTKLQQYATKTSARVAPIQEKRMSEELESQGSEEVEGTENQLTFDNLAKALIAAFPNMEEDQMQYVIEEIENFPTVTVDTTASPITRLLALNNKLETLLPLVDGKSDKQRMSKINTMFPTHKIMRIFLEGYPEAFRNIVTVAYRSKDGEYTADYRKFKDILYTQFCQMHKEENPTYLSAVEQAVGGGTHQPLSHRKRKSGGTLSINASVPENEDIEESVSETPDVKGLFNDAVRLLINAATSYQPNHPLAEARQKDAAANSGKRWKRDGGETQDEDNFHKNYNYFRYWKEFAIAGSGGYVAPGVALCVSCHRWAKDGHQDFCPREKVAVKFNDPPLNQYPSNAEETRTLLQEDMEDRLRYMREHPTFVPNTRRFQGRSNGYRGRGDRGHREFGGRGGRGRNSYYRGGRSDRGGRDFGRGGRF